MYLQEGWVYALAVWTTGAQRYLAAGGNVSHHDRPSVALIPIGGAGARLELDPANPLRCDGCPDAQPARLTLLPNSDVTRALYRPFGWVWMLRVVDGRLRVSVDAGFGEGSIALLDTGGHVSDYRFAARYWEAHRQLFDEQRLDHNVDACPHLYEVHTIDEWTAATGRWERYTVRPEAGAADEVRPTSD